VNDTPTNNQGETLRAFGLTDADFQAWLDAGLPDSAFDDWLTDRVARRPSGERARKVYGADDVHDFARRAILDHLGLGPDDSLLELGCGGGMLLREALSSCPVVVGLDHSEEMVDLARETAPAARVLFGSADILPFADGTFSAAAMSIVFLFLGDPIGVLAECRRVLRAPGRLAAYTIAPELRGTGAAPEPVARLGHFYSDAELADLARQAGFDQVRVLNDGGGQLLTARA
jgi:SAM-dependent methyltransferase